MTKTLTIILLFVAINISAQTYLGALKLSVYEKTNDKEGRRLVTNQTMTVALNDSATFSLTTNAEGHMPTIKNLVVGKYNVKVVRTGCQAYEIKDIVIGEGKTAYVSFLLTCTSYINTLTKKEKKKLGYK